MRRLILAAAGLLAAANLARADDFGGFLERAARKTARDLIDRSPAGSQGRPAGNPAPGFTGNPAPGAAAAPNPIAGLLGAVGGAEPAVETLPVRTADGWTLVAHHYKPTVAPRPGAMPVILCHGLTYNAAFWDLDPRCSLAQYLAGRGFDVWAIDLRGSGLSQKWIYRLDDAPTMLIGGALRRATKGKFAPTGYATVDLKAANWDLDDHITYDVPAFVNLVRRRTGAPEVAWIGHSMGGIVAIAHLSRYQNPGIGRLVTIGSQVTMPQGQLTLQFLREMLETRREQLTGQLSGKQLAVETRTSVHNMFFNIQNVDSKVYEALSGPAADVPALGLMQQYTTLANGGELLDARKQFNYARSVQNITIPVLFTCGAQDQFAPPPVQIYLFNHVGSADKKMVVFGRQIGQSVDAGHDDALVGLNSRAEVYPIIENWLLGAR